MSRRIIGQCNAADFANLQVLITAAGRGDEFSIPPLVKGKQKAAVMVLHHFQTCGVSFDILLKLREVLVWEMPDKGLAFEYKLLDPRDKATWFILDHMAPRTVKVKAERR